jgi:hypothetical protein
VSEAQTIDEAFLYSRSYYSGTARFQAMGGAFTSLGGDLSVLGLNPAGLGMFRGMEISFTPQMDFTNSTTDFRLQDGTDSFYGLNLGQFGVVLPLISRESAGLKSFNVGYSYNRTNSYGANTLIKGTSSNSSMADYWALEANASNSEPDFLGDNEWMAFMGYIIDTIPGTGGYDYATIFSDFGNNANSTYGQTIRRVITKEGRAGEHSFSAAGNIDDKFYFGATIGISKINLESRYSHLEHDENNNIPLFNDFTYTDAVSTEGSGFSLKIGAIYRPVSTVRIGFSFHSPTVYRLHEYYYSSLTANTDFDNYEFSFEPYRFSYTLTTPMRINTGVSLQIGKLGIVSADYEYLNHTQARFSKADDDYDYSVENEDIKNIFSAAHNLRLGAELRLNSMFYVRGGYSFYGSGFAVGEDNQDSNHSVYAAGFGVRQRNFFFDLAYSVRQNKQTYFMYGYQDVDPVDITYNRNTISATVGFKF